MLIVENGRLVGGPLIMGVLNATPDSFSDGGAHAGAELVHARQLLADGADLVDVGGESTRPGAEAVPLAAELARVVPIVRAIAALGATISIDTCKAEVARQAILAGAAIVNDVSGGLADPALLEVVAATDAFIILGHLRGTPETMAAHARYDDVLAEVRDELAERVGAARRAGVPGERILVDPGFGFAKRAEHSIRLLAHLDGLRALGCPIVVGASRKRFLSEVGARARELAVADREEATAAAHTIAVWLGADVVRVHDVARQGPAVRIAAACVRARS